MTYAEKLKDPRWQKKRLEAMEHYNWACMFCGEESKTLHVHHDKYTGEPWDAPLENLFTLCDKCHELIHALKMPCAEYLEIVHSKYFAPTATAFIEVKEKYGLKNSLAGHILYVKIIQNLIKEFGNG